MCDLSCATCVELCPEVGLGAASAEDRAAVLDHVAGCAACAASLRAMTDVGDGLVGLVPSLAPPAGFERRVLGAIREGAVPDPRPTLGGRLRSRPLAAAAAAVAAAVLALGGWVVGATTSAPTASAVTATLVSHHGSAGEVVLTPGVHPWISMAVDVGSSSATVWCQVRDDRGQLVTLGTFSLSHGYGSWAAPLPGGLSVRGARVVTRSGVVLASARLSAG